MECDISLILIVRLLVVGPDCHNTILPYHKGEGKIIMLFLPPSWSLNDFSG